MLMDRALFEEVQAVIESEIAMVVELNDILRKETSVLQTPDANGLSAVLQEKITPLARINESKGRRYSILRSSNYPESEHGWEQLVTDLDSLKNDNNITLSNLLQILRGDLTQSRTLNRINAEIINRSMFSVHHLLNILRGNSATTENNLYSNNGDTVTTENNGPLTSA